MPEDMMSQFDADQQTPVGDPNLAQQLMAMGVGQGAQQGAAQAPPLTQGTPPQGAGQGLPGGSSQMDVTPAIMERLQRERQLEGQADPLIRERGNMPLPQTQFEPHMVHGQGAGGFLHNLGQALIAIGASTRPGQAIQQQVYGGKVAQYTGRQEQLAGQIGDIQQQQTEAQKAIGPFGALSFHQGQLDIGQQKVDVAKQRAETAATKVANDLLVANERLTLGWKNLDVKQQAQNLRELFETKILPGMMQARINAGEDMNDARINSQQSLQASGVMDKWISDHPWLSGAADLLGLTPKFTSTPGAQTPREMGKPTPAPARGGASPARPANVPPGYVFKNGSKGKGWYKPGTN